MQRKNIGFAQMYACMDLSSQYSVVALRAKYTSLIASGIKADLGKAVDHLIDKIEEHVGVLFNGLEHTAKLDEYETLMNIIFREKAELRAGLSEDAKQQIAILDNRKELNESATEVIKLAVEIKLELDRQA